MVQTCDMQYISVFHLNRHAALMQSEHPLRTGMSLFLNFVKWKPTKNKKKHTQNINILNHMYFMAQPITETLQGCGKTI
jgi:hypothetical protein